MIWHLHVRLMAIASTHRRHEYTPAKSRIAVASPLEIEELESEDLTEEQAPLPSRKRPSRIPASQRGREARRGIVTLSGGVPT